MANLPPESAVAFAVNSEEEIQGENTSKDTAKDDAKSKQQHAADQGTSACFSSAFSLANLKRMLSPDTHNHATHLRLWMKP